MDWAKFIIMGVPNRDPRYTKFDSHLEVAQRV